MGIYADTAAAIADGMLHYWPADETSGKPVGDRLQQDFNADMTASNDPSGNSIVPSGLFAGVNARQMDQGKNANGAEVQLVTAAPGGGSPRTTWGWSLWFLSDNSPERTLLNWGNGDSYNGTNGVHIRVTGTTLIWANGMAEMAFGLTTGVYHNVIITRNASGHVRCFVDGVFKSGNVITSGTTAMQLELCNFVAMGYTVAGGPLTAGPFQGKMLEVGCWGRELTQTDADAIWNGGTGAQLIGAAALTAVSQNATLLWNALNSLQQDVAMLWDSLDPPPPPPRLSLGVIYRAIITGAPDSLPDHSVRLRSLSARLKSGTPSTVTLGAVIEPDTLTEIAARPNGDLVVQRVIRYSDGTETTATLATVGMDEIRDDQGGTSRALTITGSRQTTNSSPKTVALAGVSYRAARNGALQMRAAVNPAALAGDTFTYGADSFVAASVIISVANGRESMEIVE